MLRSSLKLNACKLNIIIRICVAKRESVSFLNQAYAERSNKRLLIEREVCMEKYQTEVLIV